MARIQISRTIARGIERSIVLAKVMESEHQTITFYEGLLKEADEIERNNGTRTAVKMFKYWYNIAVRTVMKESIDEKPILFQRLDKRGLPRVIRPVVKRLLNTETTDSEKRMILTALRSFELIQVTPVADLSTIEADSEGPGNFEGWKQHFEEFLNDSGFAQMVKRDFNYNVVNMKSKGPIPFHYSTKSGISGSTLGTAATQSMFFYDKEDMVDILCDLNFIFHEDESFREMLYDNQMFIMDGNRDLVVPKLPENIKTYSGRISFIPDKGAKTRCIAIGNYWIQNTLKPLHSMMFETLRHIAMDGTFDQISQSTRVAKATEDGPVWSYDLTAATDRLPLNIQETVMSFLNPEIGNHWSKLLRKLTFCYKNKEVKYAVGQPMGFYSSWASLALTHHFIVQYCAFLVGAKAPFLRYAILGDDVAIWDEPTALMYEKLIQNLGVSISKAKSYIPKSKIGPWKAEFAKRHFLDGKEVSGIGADVLKEGLVDFWSFPELTTFLVRHGMPEIVHTPVSRVAKVLKLKAPEAQQLVCAFHINEILGGPSIKTDLVLDTIINEFVSSVTTTRLLEERMQVLIESILNLWTDLFFLRRQDEEDLDKVYDTIPEAEYLVIKLVLATRRKEIIELGQRMVMEIPRNEESTKFEPEQITLESYQDQVLSKIKDIEFIPSLRLSEIMLGIESHTDKKRYRILFLKKLVQRLIKALSKE